MTEVRGGWTGGATYVEVAPGFEMPTPVIVDVINWEGYDLNLTFELEDGRYQCSNLNVRRRPGGPEIVNEALRSVPVARFKHEGMPAVAAIPNDLPNQAERGPTQENLEWVAALYRLAFAVGNAPKQAVADRFGIAPATAGRWIARARDAGLLGSTQTGQAAI